MFWLSFGICFVIKESIQRILLEVKNKENNRFKKLIKLKIKTVGFDKDTQMLKSFASLVIVDFKVYNY